MSAQQRRERHVPRDARDAAGARRSRYAAGDEREPGRTSEALARARLAAELAQLPPWKSAVLWERLRAAEPAAVSLGAHVGFLRLAVRQRDLPAAQELFVILLERIERMNRRWAARIVTLAPARRGAGASPSGEDLRQELTLHLWQQIALRADEAWELYFASALAYAQRHAATAYMERNGFWAAASSATPMRGPALLLSRLAAYRAEDGANGDPPMEALLADPRDPLTAADLADLRDLVDALPRRERDAVVSRFWIGASERDIALALCVTTRTVRNLLARAYARLRAAYAPDESDGGAASTGRA
jgi:DNA-directed RNA polymerase specialized sigma24 family protein